MCNVATGCGETGSPLPKPLDHLFNSNEDIGGGGIALQAPPPHIVGVSATMTHNGDVRNMTFSPFGDTLDEEPSRFGIYNNDVLLGSDFQTQRGLRHEHRHADHCLGSASDKFCQVFQCLIQL